MKKILVLTIALSLPFTTFPTRGDKKDGMMSDAGKYAHIAAAERVCSSIDAATDKLTNSVDRACDTIDNANDTALEIMDEGQKILLGIAVIAIPVIAAGYGIHSACWVWIPLC
jgi:hypothetical protein